MIEATQTFGAYSVLRRNFKVWQKLIIASLLGNFAEPLLYIAAIGYGLGRFIGEMGGLPYEVFLATGIICSTAMNTASFEGMYSCYTRMAVQKTWEGILMTPLGVRDIVLGELLWIATKTLMNGTCILLVITFLGLVSGWQVLLALPCIFLAGLCFGSLALIVTSFSKSYDFFVYYFTLVVSPMMLFSGVFFPVDALPDAIKVLINILPLSHVVALVRPVLTGQDLINPLLHIMVLLGYVAICFSVAAYRIKKRLMS